MARAFRIALVSAAFLAPVAVTGCGSATTPTKASGDKMVGDKMGGDKMGGDKMAPATTK